MKGDRSAIARDAYVRELDSILLPRFETQIQSRLVKYSGDPQRLYVYFKGYLMLGEPKHLDKEYLQRLADSEWKHAEGGAAAAGPAVSQHFKALMDNASTLRPLPLDGRLVGQARSSLPRTLMPRILYDDIKASNVDEPGQGLRIDQAAGLGAEKVFSRRSGVPLSTPMPRLYTKPQFNVITIQGRAEMVQLLQKDAWVWGDSAASLANAGSIFSGVSDLYETDYMQRWDGLLDDLQFVRFTTMAQANEALKILTSPTSPLRGLLTVIAANTTLVENQTAAPKGVVDQTKKKVTDTIAGVLKPMEDAVGMAAVQPGTRVTAHYQWVRQLSGGEAGKTPLDAVINSIGEIQKQIDTLGPDVAGGSSLQILSNPSFRVLLQSLRQQAATLPPAVGRIVSEIADAPEANVIRSATGQVEEVYTQRIVPMCTSLIGNKYPFASAQSDVQLTDFGTVFGYDGLFDKFFAEYLEKQVDTTGSIWTWRPGSVTPSHHLLEQMQQARYIRDMFFNPGSKMPEVKFFVTFSDLDSSTQRFVLQIDGQTTDTKGQKQPVTWPGPMPGNAIPTFEARYFDPPKPYGGPWAWFRMVDDHRAGAPDAQQRIGLSIQDSYHRVRVTVEPARATGNPFASGSWRQFSCES